MEMLRTVNILPVAYRSLKVLTANINKFILSYIPCFSLTEFIYSGSFPNTISNSEVWVHTHRKQTDSNHLEARVSDWSGCSLQGNKYGGMGQEWTFKN